MKYFPRPALSLLALAVATTTQTAWAKHIEELLVKGQHLHSDRVNALRTPTPIIDVPQSLSIITAAQINQQGFNSIGDIINYTPGVTTSQGEGHRDALVIRGIRSTADFYVDGSRDDVQYYRPLYNLEQVEILRGPNALLFGRGGTGGIVNRVTKKGQVGESFTGYKVGAGTFGDYNLEIDTNVTTGDNSALRINAHYEQLENHRDFFDGERFGVNPTLRFTLTPETILDVSYEYLDHDRFIDRGIPTGADGEPVDEFDDIVFGDPELNFTTLEAHVFRAALQHRFSDMLKGNASVFYGDYDKVYSNFYASSYNEIDSPEEVTLDGYVDTTQRENLILSSNLVGEFDWGNTSHTIIGGLEYIDTTSDQDRFNAFWSDSGEDTETFALAPVLNLRNGIGVTADGNTTINDFTVDLNDDTRVDIEVVSLYLQDEIELTDNFDLIIGARYDSFDIEVDNVDPDAEDNFGVRENKDEKVSPRFGLIYKPQENISLYASYSESFLPRSGEQFANINGDNDALDPNTFENLEAGIKWDIRNNLSLTAAVFEIEQRSPEVDTDNPENLIVLETTTTGFEAELRGQITDAWALSAGYSYLDGEQAESGKDPREQPENLFSAWNMFKVTDRFGFGVGVIYQSASFADNGNDAKLPSYTRFDAAAFYRVSEDLRVQLNIENLTDERYYPNSHSTHQITVGEELNARLSITGRF